MPVAANRDDIKWTLNALRNPHAARQLLVHLGQYLPVYSPGARQMYFKYTLHFTESGPKPTVVALPDTVDHTATISHITPDAVTVVDLFLIPTSEGVKLLLPLKRKSPNHPRRFRILTIEAALSAFRAHYGDRPILPVLQRGNIRDYHKSPILQLSLLKLEHLNTLSSFEKITVGNMVKERFDDLGAASSRILIGND